MLLEVLISLFIVSMCSLVILTPTIMLYQAQRKLVERVFVDMKAAELAIELKEHFYKGEEGVKKILRSLTPKKSNHRKRENGYEYTAPQEIAIPLLGDQKVDYRWSSSLYTLKKPKDEEAKVKYYYLTLRLYFDRVKGNESYWYDYSFMIIDQEFGSEET